jgi:hypothetical protein
MSIARATGALQISPAWRRRLAVALPMVGGRSAIGWNVVAGVLGVVFTAAGVRSALQGDAVRHGRWMLRSFATSPSCSKIVWPWVTSPYRSSKATFTILLVAPCAWAVRHAAATRARFRTMVRNIS